MTRKHTSPFRNIGLKLLFAGGLCSYSFQPDVTFQTKDKMKNAVLNAKGELAITASAGSNAADFDFLLGMHQVNHRRLKTRLTGSTDWQEFSGTHRMERLLHGRGNIEQHVLHFPEGQVEGMAVRLFNPATKLWSIYWADSNSGRLDPPVTGSFENNIGHFFGEDHVGGRSILLQFKWDATDRDHPIWSQAFSSDRGKTWEWNWHMHFSKETVENKQATVGPADSTPPIGIIELRNYVVKHGLRDSFIHYFEEHFIASQKVVNGYVLGQYRVKGSEDNFCWIRGFRNIKERSSFLPAFYYGPVWKQHKTVANAMLANNDNVYLLRPLLLRNDSLEPAASIPPSAVIPAQGIAVVDFYIANTKLDQLLRLFAQRYLAILQACGVHQYTLWISVLEENDFPRLPVFQDKNLLVMITFYKNELDFEETSKKINLKTSEDLHTLLQDAITTKNTMILYPSEKMLGQSSDR